MKVKKILSLAIILSMLFIAKSLWATPIASSNFNDGTLQGWLRKNDGKTGTISNPGTKDNSDGYMLFTDGRSGSPSENVVAPTEYLGDWSQALLFPNTSFIDLDAILIDPHINQNSWDQIIIYISGNSGSAYIDLGLPKNVGEWEHFKAYLRESDWNISSGSWSEILKNISSFEIQMDWVNPALKQTGIDNIVLDIGNDSNCVPEPSTFIMVIFGILLFAGLKLKKAKIKNLLK